MLVPYHGECFLKIPENSLNLDAKIMNYVIIVMKESIFINKIATTWF